ncbi:hypothetical protein CRUP_032783 [Coryphaenoides rupestris]|nr:hypothetical protein CRUP_032783 [Coryphaenoides rupestris]
MTYTQPTPNADGLRSHGAWLACGRSATASACRCTDSSSDGNTDSDTYSNSSSGGMRPAVPPHPAHRPAHPYPGHPPYAEGTDVGAVPCVYQDYQVVQQECIYGSQSSPGAVGGERASGPRACPESPSTPCASIEQLRTEPNLLVSCLAYWALPGCPGVRGVGQQAFEFISHWCCTRLKGSLRSGAVGLSGPSRGGVLIARGVVERVETAAGAPWGAGGCTGRCLHAFHNPTSNKDAAP